jgi:hypothetical protein
MAQQGIKSLTKSNLTYWLENKLLTAGLYINVPSGDLNYYGQDLSILVPVVDDPTYASGTLFQSAFKNWVHESGITPSESGLAAPIVCSGAYVDNAFVARGAGVKVDYPNGRVIFSSPQTGTVRASFAYKMVGVDDADRFDNENMPLLIETHYKDNPMQTGVQTYPTAISRTLPMVFVEFTERRNAAYEIGSASLIAELRGVFHVWSRDQMIPDIVEDILTNAQQEVLIGIDFNRAEYPLNHEGDKNSGFTSYDEMADIHHSLRWRRIYLDEVNSRKQKPLYEVQRTRVDFLARVYPSF